MAGVPSLPAGGPLRLLAVAGALALLAFALAAALVARQRRRGATAWASAPLVLAIFAFLAARLARTAHPIVALSTTIVAARNVLRLSGPARAIELLGLIAWCTALVAARSLFGR